MRHRLENSARDTVAAFVKRAVAQHPRSRGRVTAGHHRRRGRNRKDAGRNRKDAVYLRPGTASVANVEGDVYKTP